MWQKNLPDKRTRIVGFLLLLMIVTAIPLTILLTRQEQDTRQRADVSTTLTFSPTSTSTAPIKQLPNSTVGLDVMINPGNNLVSVITYEVTFDPTKVTVSTASDVTVNQTAFPQSLEGPIVSSGKIAGTVSIGSDYSKAITQSTKVATIHFKTLGTTGTTPTKIQYTTRAQVLSVGAKEQATENVLSSTTPAFILIQNSATPTPTKIPTPTTATPTKTPSATPTNTPIPTPSGTACKASTDTILLVDKSGSMSDRTSASDATPRITRLKQAATVFADLMSKDPNHRLGVASFADPQTSKLELGLTNNIGSVKTVINALTPTGYTCTSCGVTFSNNEISSKGRSGIKKVVILLSDGGTTRMLDGSIGTVPYVAGEKQTMDLILQGYKNSGITYYTIGFGEGKDTRPTFLQEVAAETGGKYYFAPDGPALQAVFQQIASDLAKGGINGTAFNDADGDKTLDTGESGLAGWTVTLKNGSTVISNQTTDTQGRYTFGNLCDGTYSVTVAQKDSSMSPTTPTNQTVTINKGSTAANKDFGFKLNAPTRFTITAFMHGLGNSGDNPNPTAHSLSNKNPLHKARSIVVELFDATDKLVATKSSTVTYAASQGNFTGTVDMGTLINTGTYIIKIKSPQYLKKRAPGIQTVQAGQATTLPALTFVTGDIKSDNVLNILDYNIIIGCYSDFAPALSCTAEQKLASDLTDDGKVNQFDYNLFLRDLSVQSGD